MQTATSVFSMLSIVTMFKKKKKKKKETEAIIFLKDDAHLNFFRARNKRVSTACYESLIQVRIQVSSWVTNLQWKSLGVAW